MISSFPKFQKLHISHKEYIEEFMKKFPPYSDYNFTSMWTYDTEETVELCELNKNLVVKFSDYLTNDSFLSFIGINQVKDTIRELLSYAVQVKLPKYLKLIPQEAIDNFPNIHSKYTIVEDIDNHDYILAIQEIAELKGKKYYDKRNLVNRFKKKYPQAVVNILDITEVEVQNDIKKLFLFWSQQSNKTIEESNTEMHAIERLFTLSPRIKCFAIGAYDGGRLIGFTTYELTHNNHSIMSFEKGDKTYEGIYSLLNHETSKHLHTLGYTHINYEQDLGISGLRKAKSLWRPVHHLKKYIISPKT